VHAFGALGSSTSKLGLPEFAVKADAGRASSHRATISYSFVAREKVPKTRDRGLHLPGHWLAGVVVHRFSGYRWISTWRRE